MHYHCHTIIVNTKHEYKKNNRNYPNENTNKRRKTVLHLYFHLLPVRHFILAINQRNQSERKVTYYSNGM